MDSREFILIYLVSDASALNGRTAAEHAYFEWMVRYRFSSRNAESPVDTQSHLIGNYF